MGKSLVIVESPAKAKTINRYLGNDYIVKSSVGHIRDLPTSGQSRPVDAKARARQAAETRKLSPEQKARHKQRKAKEQLITRMGIDPENDWQAQYQVLPGKEKVVEELRRLARTADTVYLATDLDREGEAIAWHLQESIGQAPEKYRRVVFNEITKKAIQEAFEEPGELDLNRVNAQQARRFLDRVVGYMVSPLLWAKVARGLSAGRVQSVAVRLIVEREREIRAFVPEEFWDLHALTRTDSGTGVRFEVARYQGEKYRPVNEQQSNAHVERLSGADLAITDREDKPTQSRPAAPFITSTLQQAASTRLGYSVKKTMTMAQRLYEAGHITYMRTDSTNLSGEAVASARDFIQDEFGGDYLPEKPQVYGSREGAQEAHEAIRPSYVQRRSSQLGDMERDAQRLYELIWQRFVACQMVPARYKSTTLTIRTGDYELKARGRVVVFDGYTRVMAQPTRGDDATELPDLKVGDGLSLEALEPKQHFTKPPARYTEASLVKELEKLGIGRPSTYASIISTIQDRGYARLENRRFYAEKIGDIVTDRLTESFRDLLEYQFTARLEEYLDEIAAGKRTWKEVLDSFYEDFTRQLAQAESKEGGMRANEPTPTDIECPRCGRPMMVRNGTTGVFLGCSGYSLPPKERCKGTLNLVPGEEALTVDEDDDEAEAQALRHKERCDRCGTAMDAYLIDEGRKLHICGNNPDCPGFKVERGQFKIKGYDGPTLECDKCGSEMQLKSGRFGKYFGCTNEDCKNTRKLLRNGEPAPPKMDPVPMPELKCQKVDDTYVLRDGASGLFLAASQFPKNRETRPPQVRELLPHQAEIPEKYQYILEAPAEDDQGRPSVIRYSRKTREQYVMTEDDSGKATGWRAYYQDGQWRVDAKPKPKAKAKAKPKAKAKAKAKAKPKAAARKKANA